MKKPTISLCLIVKASDEEASVLNRLLTLIPPIFDEICITITGKNKKVEEVAKKHGAKISYFKWINDFSAARNYNFSQAKSDYIMWVDADDIIQGAENIPKLLEKIGKENNIVDGVVMEYLYDFDEYRVCVVKHLKTRIVKNDGCVKWEGKLHEDFSPQRNLMVVKNTEIKIAHLTDNNRLKQNFERNTEIAKESLKLNPNDPRNLWLVANALLSEGKGQEALPYYFSFIDKSSSEEEIFMAWSRVAGVYADIKDIERAFMSQLQAFRLRPNYPDSYYGLGRLYLEQGKLKEAETVILDGLKKKIPEDDIIVYNPRDYDVNPLNLLARVYFSQEKPREAKMCLEKILKIYPHKKDIIDIIKGIDERIKELDKVEKHTKRILKAKNKKEIKELLDKVPDELKSHPAICAIRNQHFIKTESTGKDLVYFCGYTREVWNPETVKQKGIGGSEEAVINLSKELVKLGWNVTVYNNCGHQEKTFDGVIYKPFWSWNHRDKNDVVILWRHPKMLDFEINADKLIVDLHDVVGVNEFTPIRLKKVHKIFVKSKAQRKLYPQIPDNKVEIIPNGVDVGLFEKWEGKIVRNPKLMVNFSSPDRSLETSLDMVEEIAKEVPDVKFEWYYGWDVFDAVFERDPEANQWKEKIIKKFEDLKAKGIVDGGYRINHEEVAKKYLEAGFLFYPTEFYEIDYIGGSKAQIAGTIPITTDFAALDEKIQYGSKIHSLKTKDDWIKDIKFNYGIKDRKTWDAFVSEVKRFLLFKFPRGVNIEETRKEMIDWAKKEFNWTRIGNLWNKAI